MPKNALPTDIPKPRKAGKQTLGLALLNAACSSNSLTLKIALNAGASTEAILKKGSKARAALRPYLREHTLKTDATALSICGLLAADPHAGAGLPERALRCARLLIERGARPDGAGPGSSTPLSSMAEHFSRHHPPQCPGRDGACLALVEALADAGADMDAPGDSGFTPLALALIGGHVELARSLIRRGADILHRDFEGRSIPWLLAREGEAHALPLALEMGADPSAPDAKGRSPLLSALASEASDPARVSCIRALIRHGCRLGEAELRAMRHSNLTRSLQGPIAQAEASALSMAAKPATSPARASPSL